MGLKYPRIAEPADWRPRFLRQAVGLVFGAVVSVVQAFDSKIDFGRIEAGQLEAEVEVDRGQLLEGLGEQAVVPVSNSAELVIRNHKGRGLCLIQMPSLNGRNFSDAETLGGKDATVASNDVPVAIDEDRHKKSKLPDASGDFLYLPTLVPIRVPGIELKAADRQVPDRYLKLRPSIWLRR
jgi:hypothetical protein